MGRGADQERVIPAVFTALVTPVGVLFVIQGFLGMLVGVLYVAIGILLMVANADSVMGILLFLACALQFVVSWLYWKLGKKILAGRRWAWVVGCLLSSAPFLALFGILLVRPDFMSVLPFTYDAIRLLLIFPGYMTVALALAAIADIVIRGHYRRREGRAARQAAASQALAGG